MWIVAWSINHGQDNIEDFWTVEESEDEAQAAYEGVLGYANLHCACFAPIQAGTEPQWIIGERA